MIILSSLFPSDWIYKPTDTLETAKKGGRRVRHDCEEQSLEKKGAVFSSDSLNLNMPYNHH